MPANRYKIALALAAALLGGGVGGGRAEAQIVDMTASVGIEQAFDSNVFNGRGQDFVTRVSPRLALGMRDHMYEATLEYDLGLWNYLEGKADSTVNQHARASLDLHPERRLTLHVDDELVIAQDPAFLVRAGVVAPQTGILDNTVDAAGDFWLTHRLDGALSYSYRTTQFDQPPAPAAQLHDGTEHDAEAAMMLRATRRDEVRLGNRYTYYTADGTGLANADSPTLAWHHAWLRDLDSRVEAGPLWYGGLGGTPSAWTWRGTGLVRYATPTWRASLNYIHDLVGGTGAATVLWTDWLYGQLGYHFGEAVSARAGVGFFANGLAPAEPRLYDGVNANAAVDVRILTNLRIEGFYAFNWQETVAPVGVDPFAAVTRHIVGARLYAVFGAETHRPREVH